MSGTRARSATSATMPPSVRTYYRESEQVLLEATGGEKVVVFDHTLRDSQSGSRSTASLREPVRRVHNDQTFVSGPRRVRDHLPADEAAHRLQHRFAIINLWRPLDVVDQLPLALCDARSISTSDLVPSDLVYRDKVGETFSFTYNAAIVGTTSPKLRPDEALLLKIYDSREDGTARLTRPHGIRRSDDARQRCASTEHRVAGADFLEGLSGSGQVRAMPGQPTHAAFLIT